jgi:hypothetical protein
MLTTDMAPEGRTAKNDRGNDCNRSAAIKSERDANGTNSAPVAPVQDRGLLTPRFRVLIDEAIDQVNAQSRAEFGLSFTAHILLEFAKSQPRLYGLTNLSACGPAYWDFKRRWPKTFRRLKGPPHTLWQVYNGFGEPLGKPWQFSEYDALCVDRAWCYASDNVCVLYDTRGPGDGYWLRLAHAVDATTHPARCVRELLGDWLPPIT